MRLSTLAKLAAAAALALTVGVIAVVKSIDFNKLKGAIQVQVKAATGRELVIAGPLELKLGASPAIIATGVSLSNMKGGSRPEMVKAEKLEAEISLVQLLKRELRIQRLVLVAPDILIETDAKGHGNWQFDLGKPETGADGTPPTRFSLRELRLKNGRIAWRDGITGRTEAINLHKVALLPEQGGAGPLSLQVVGDHNSRYFDVSGHLGGLSSGGAKPLPVRLKASFNNMLLVAEGTIREPLAGKGLDVKVKAQGEELSTLLKLAGLLPDPPAMGPFKLAARLDDGAGPLTLTDIEAAFGKRDMALVNAKGVVRDLLEGAGVEFALQVESENLAGLSHLLGAELPHLGPLALGATLSTHHQAWRLADIKASLAGNDVTGELSLDGNAIRPRLAGHLASPKLDLGALTIPPAKPGEKLAPPAPKPAGDGRVFLAEPLPFDTLSRWDGELSLAAANLVLPSGARLGDVGTTLHLKRGQLAAKPIHALAGGGTVTGEASLDANTRTAGLTLSGTNVELGRLAKEAGSDLLSGGRADFTADLRGKGDSPRALMAGLNGEVVVGIGEGRLNNRMVDWAGGDLLFQLLGALNPLARSEDSSPLSCGALRLTVKDGIAQADRGIALETARMAVVGSGTIDLREEKLDMGFAPRARDGIGFSLGSEVAAMTRLRGTIANPSLGLDELGTARKAASVGAAMATGGLSLLGELIFDRVTADASPCQTALAKAPRPKSARKAGLPGR